MSDCCFNLRDSNLCSSLLLSDSICLVSCCSNHFWMVFSKPGPLFLCFFFSWLSKLISVPLFLRLFAWFLPILGSSYSSFSSFFSFPSFSWSISKLSWSSLGSLVSSFFDKILEESMQDFGFNVGLSLFKIASISFLYWIVIGGPPLFFDSASCVLNKKK